MQVVLPVIDMLAAIPVVVVHTSAFFPLIVVHVVMVITLVRMIVTMILANAMPPVSVIARVQRATALRI